MSDKKIYKVVVESTFYEARKKKNGELERPRKHTRQQVNGEIAVDTLSDALDILSNAVHLAIKEHGNKDRFSLHYSLHYISAKCKECGAWLKTPRTIVNGYYDGEFFMSTISSTRKHYGSFQSMIITVLTNNNE